MSEQDKTTPMDEQTTTQAGPGEADTRPADSGRPSAAGKDKERDKEMSLEEQLQAERSKAAEYLENWQRSHAEFVNYRRRAENERADTVAFANASLITKLLPALDDFDLALANVPEEQRKSPWVEGVEIIRRKLQRTLESEGVTPIEAEGQPFDPHLHEAVSMEEGAGGELVVVDELRKGYRLRDKVLRPALVRVGGAPPTSD